MKESLLLTVLQSVQISINPNKTNAGVNTSVPMNATLKQYKENSYYPSECILIINYSKTRDVYAALSQGVYHLVLLSTFILQASLC
jgi:hypothetical protein